MKSNETQFNIYELDGYTSIPDLLDIIDLLSREKDRSINVQNQKSLKKSFRQINASLKDGSAPSGCYSLLILYIIFNNNNGDHYHNDRIIYYYKSPVTITFHELL
jgi:hypothetical protein